jgi:peptidoglycan/LPS O-acetylase OafA/YrhL
MPTSRVLPPAYTEGALDAAASTRSNPIDFRVRLPALDGLRGLAILAVFAFHYAGGGPQHPGSLVLKLMYGFTRFGWAGVDLFFVLSGFLITGILYDTKDDPRYFRNFYLRRSLRIFPVYYAFVLVIGIVGALAGVRWTFGHLSFFAYLGYPATLIWPELVPDTPLIRITHLWSLCVEEQFYMVWPLLVFVLSSSRRILLLCGAYVSLALGMRLLIWQTGWVSPEWAITFLPFRMDSLALGGALAILVRGPRIATVTQVAPVILGCAGVCLFGLCLIAPTTMYTDPSMWTLGFTLISLVSASLVLLAIQPGGVVRWLFSGRFLRAFGKYSYGMYVYHFPLLALLTPMRSPLLSVLGSEVLAKVTFVLASLAINFALAFASFRYFESPILKLKSRFDYDRNSAPRPAGVLV